MSDGGRQHRPGSTPNLGPEKAPEDPTYLPRGVGDDRSWPLTDPMRYVRAERQQAAAQIQRSLKAWRQEKEKSEGARQAPIPEGGGSPLAGHVRGKMEKQLGADLSGARIHTGGGSAQAAEGMGARAFTVGRDVHFGSGQFAPGTKEGDRLLAHELTHVVQGQRSGIQRKADGDEAVDGPEVSHPEEPAEQEADAVSEKVADRLHGQDQHGDQEAAKPGKQQSAPVAAKLARSLKIFRAGEHKRGDHVFNNGLAKAIGEMSSIAAGSASSAAKKLATSLNDMKSAVSTDAFHITVDKGGKGASAGDGDANSQAFGKAKAAALAAFNGFIGAIEAAESAPPTDADKEHKALTAAAATAEAKFGEMVANSFDSAAVAKVTSKSDKALIDGARKILDGLPGTFNGAMTAATTGVAHKPDAAKGNATPKDAAGGGGKPPKK